MTKVLEVKPDYKILITFSTNEQKIFDVSPYIFGDWYGKLQDLDYFKTVRPSGRTVEWEGGQDIAPHELYDLSKAL
ncbi:MAG: DUF2442 domain-containing protein [Clostridia bacterium]